jgi:plasmid stabilization system protein ParE
MTLPVRFLPEARQDALDIRCWYEQRLGGLGDLFSQSLADAIDRLQAHPLRYR